MKSGLSRRSRDLAPTLWRAKEAVRAALQRRSYERDRREWQKRLAGRKGPRGAAAVTEQVRRRLRDRGFLFPSGASGPIHTFAIVARVGWQGQLYDELRELGEVSEFDFRELHIPPVGGDRHLLSSLTEEMQRAFTEAQKRRPVDWIFCYAAPHPYQFLPWVYRTYGTPSASVAMDDKNAWNWWHDDYYQLFDLCLTTASECAGRYESVGARGLFMPPGFTPLPEPVSDRPVDIPVSFVGAAYGPRPEIIRYLRGNGIDVQVYGAEWGSMGRGYADSPADIFRRSQINLGFGGVLHCEDITTVKGRDFEVVGAGGGVYLTTFNADLTSSFRVGEEILCYANRTDLAELIKHYLERPEECTRIARGGYRRCLREHRWLHRFRSILGILGHPRMGTP